MPPPRMMKIENTSQRMFCVSSGRLVRFFFGMYKATLMDCLLDSKLYDYVRPITYSFIKVSNRNKVYSSDDIPITFRNGY